MVMFTLIFYQLHNEQQYWPLSTILLHQQMIKKKIRHK